jgi:hypothetical protein
MSDEKFLFFDQLPAFLERETGLRLSVPTLHKICSPGIATGPRPAAFWGRRPVFKPSTVLEWARARLSSVPTNISPKRETPPLVRRGKTKELGITRHEKDNPTPRGAQ